MKNLIIATFPAKPDTYDVLRDAMAASLPQTRAFDGCISLEVYREDNTHTFTVVEDWESFEHYDRYIEWRRANGLDAMLDQLLEGGADAFRIQKFHAVEA